VSLDRIADRYLEILAEGKHRSLMITGGEPLMRPDLAGIIGTANALFESVHLTSASVAAFEFLRGRELGGMQNFLDSFVYSIHDPAADIPERVDLRIPCYAAIMSYSYSVELLEQLRAVGFAGVTINEDHRAGGDLFFPAEAELPKWEGFSIRANRAGGLCLDHPVMLPDLQIVNSFRSFL
jgi:MoaA/NifB/PqqE/SkfB family radical SAM enzyme